MQVLVDGLTDVLVSPPPVVWIVVFAVLALAVRGPWLALYTVLAFLLVVSLELWVETMQTLALVLVAAVVATALWGAVGILGARARGGSGVGPPGPDHIPGGAGVGSLLPGGVFFRLGGLAV